MRNSTIDIAKGIGILTVVLCHNWILYHDRGELSRVIFSFHMPLFFFISGIFFKPNQPFGDLVTSKSSVLLKPFFVVLFGVFIWELFTKPSFNAQRGLMNIFYASSSSISWTPLWFLSHLFAIFLFAWLVNQTILKHIKQDLGKGLFILAMLFLGTLFLKLFWEKPINPFGINHLIFGSGDILKGLPFTLDIILVTSAFFLAGYLLAGKLLTFQFNKLLTLIAFAIFTGLHYFYNETIGLHIRDFGNFIICTMQIISGIYLVFALASLCTKVNWLNKSLSYLGAASLYILIFHFMPQHMLTGIFQYHFPNHLELIAALSMIASIIFSLILWEITKKSRILQMLMLPIKRLQK
jgi:polysaccharide biosynthesis protein PslL